ncbi:MAG: sodium-dependent transporter, partial [Acidobacteriota bacterium]|nr:sodium-dependent transporter [Acidobacteriota bacterium]
AFAKLAPGTWWPALGGLGVATGFAILAFYSVIAGWTVGYLAKAVTGKFASGLSIEQSQGVFAELSGNPVHAATWTAVFFVLTMLVVRGGIHAGIERVSKILMPIFFILLVGLAVRSVTLPGAGEGIRFLFNTDFHKIKPNVILDALSQALFSMSLGMGAMITYGSYLSRKENMPKAGMIVAAFDTGIALLAGLMIFPALFSAGAEPAGEVGLVFEVLPTIFDALPMGQMFAIGFYALLAIAALTSSISLLEVVVSYFVDERKWSREKATWLLGAGCFLVAVPCAISGDFMNIVVQIFYTYALAVGALLICLFVGWKWGTASARGELTADGSSLPGLPLWALLIKFLCPLVVGIIVVRRLLDLF